MIRTLRTPAFLFLAAVIVLSLAAFSFTYTVPYNERAVVTFFGRANDASVQEAPGLQVKLPYPFQSVTSYDTRLQLVEIIGTQQQTADDNQIVLEAYALWRVSSPLTFFQRFSNAGQNAEDHYALAERNVKSSLNSAVSVTSGFRLDELFTVSEEGSKLPELESAILDVLRRDAGDPLAADSMGIEIVDVGINRVRLTETNSEDVINRMRADRTRLAEETVSQGEALAQTIRSRAENDAQRISSFADRLSKSIRARGEEEAGTFLAQMQESPELAKLLAELQFLRDAYSKKITLVISGAPGFRYAEPSFVDDVVAGESDADEPRDTVAEGASR
ncbi:MAG: SPFH domain-containing protein [Planctomycetota bacterium]